MENIILLEVLRTMAKGLLLFTIIISFTIVVREIFKLFRKSIDNDSQLFAYNTIHNHARVSGVSKTGKITHQKISSGGSGIMSASLSQKNQNSLKDVEISFKGAKSRFTFLPQSRLHGVGWYS